MFLLPSFVLSLQEIRKSNGQFLASPVVMSLATITNRAKPPKVQPESSCALVCASMSTCHPYAHACMHEGWEGCPKGERGNRLVYSDAAQGLHDHANISLHLLLWMVLHWCVGFSGSRLNRGGVWRVAVALTSIEDLPTQETCPVKRRSRLRHRDPGSRTHCEKADMPHALRYSGFRSHLSGSVRCIVQEEKGKTHSVSGIHLSVLAGICDQNKGVAGRLNLLAETPLYTYT